MIPVPALVAIGAAWALWAVPFFGRPKGGAAQTLDKRARWGIALEGVGFFFVWSAWAWAATPTPWWRWAAAVPLLVAGTEIRVRIEDALLSSRFGPAFEAYRSRVSAYIPFVR